MKFLLPFVTLLFLSHSALTAEFQITCEGSGKFSSIKSQSITLDTVQNSKAPLLETENLKVHLALHPLADNSPEALLGILVFEKDSQGNISTHSSHGSASSFVMYHEVTSDWVKNGIICN